MVKMFIKNKCFQPLGSSFFRYPTFIDALRDLDDALSMLFLFGTMPKTDRLQVNENNFDTFHC